MSVKRVLIVVVVAGALLLAVGSGPQFTGTARALPPVQEPGPTGATVPYPGQLTDGAGEPVADGAYDFTFALYGSETGGEPLWTETQEGVTVQGGAFTALLGSVAPVSKEVLEGGVRWLAVGVRGPGEAGFTALTPRQQLSTAASTSPASPSAGPACPHDHLGEYWTGTSTTTNDGLRVENKRGGGNGVVGLAPNGTSAWAVLGYSSPGIGVRGNTDSGTGVWGNASTGVGVHGESGSNDGVSGTASASNKSGVYGYNGGSGYGVAGRSVNGFGLEATGGGDATGSDLMGDLVLRGERGEIFSFGSAYLDLYSNSDVYIDLDNDNNNANAVFRIYDGTDYVIHEIREDGTKSAVLQTESYGRRAVYTIESPEVWLQDFGSASLVDGAATVAFEPIFAEMVNLEVDYHVFVTPVCQEPVLLFVMAKSTSGFTVRGVTLDGQPAACGFDYNVVAKRLGLENVRLEPPTVSASGGGK